MEASPDGTWDQQLDQKDEPITIWDRNLSEGDPLTTKKVALQQKEKQLLSGGDYPVHGYGGEMSQSSKTDPLHWRKIFGRYTS